MGLYTLPSWTRAAPLQGVASRKILKAVNFVEIVLPWLLGLGRPLMSFADVNEQELVWSPFTFTGIGFQGPEELCYRTA